MNCTLHDKKQLDRHHRSSRGGCNGDCYGCGWNMTTVAARSRKLRETGLTCVDGKWRLVLKNGF